IEDLEHYQRIFGRLAERISLMDQPTGPLPRRLGFQRSIPFDVDERGDERNLKLHLDAPPRGRGGQDPNLVQSAGELRYCFHQRRPLQRSLSCFAPPFDRRFGKAGLGKVVRQQLWLDRRSGGEVVAQNLSETTVQHLTRAPE